MKHTFTVLLVVALLAAATIPASASSPDWHCDSVEVTATTTGYTVVATGGGAWWRIVQVGGGVIAGPQRSKTFTSVQLVQGVEYQAQAADNQAGPWSNNAGCVFTPPIPQGIVIASFAGQCVEKGVRLEWETVSEIGVFSFALSLHDAVIATIQAQHPGSPIGASYVYTDTSTGGVYTLAVFDGEPATVTVSCAPTAVELASFTAAKSCQCYVGNRWVAWPCGRVAERACSVWSKGR